MNEQLCATPGVMTEGADASQSRSLPMRELGFSGLGSLMRAGIFGDFADHSDPRSPSTAQLVRHRFRPL
ncbi:hypothetical protein MPLDJ20_260142 [Mesorhizobium plurifarium]|uniref:Uncharacterized protein n=1 Tax=Mesorhizobium plurifarium TaxID=69974 RepID=A0A090F7N3_MESPL|nr:hypothetical protein MPLDJ20_260142 [Mesorhizobium plurifarium]